MFDWIQITPFANFLLNGIIIVVELGILGILIPLALSFITVAINELSNTLKEISRPKENRDEE